MQSPVFTPGFFLLKATENEFSASMRLFKK